MRSRIGDDDDHVKLPDNITAGLSEITVSTDVYIEASQANPYFIWGLGNTADSSTGTGYLMAPGNAFRAATTTGTWSGEKVTARTSGGNHTRGVWKTSPTPRPARPTTCSASPTTPPFVHVNPITHLVTAGRGLMGGTATAAQIGWVLIAGVTPSP